MEVPIEDCESARVYKRSSARRALVWAAVLACYAASIPFCVRTAGEPRVAAMLQAQKLAEEKWANELAQQANETAAVDGGSEVSSSASVISAPVPALEAATLDLSALDQPQPQSSGGFMSSWFGPSKEQRRAEAELKRFEKQFKERSADPPSLPPSYLPSAWAVLALMASFTFHALFFLLCRWIPAFEAATLFEPVRAGEALDETCLVLVSPPPNRGKPEIVPMTRPAGVASFLQIEFQRQKYFYVPPSRLGADDRFPRGLFSLAACPVGLPVPHYLAASGLRSEADVQAATERFGKNILAVHIPSFLELLKNQLLSPLSMFQVFCAMLWLLDEYWSYTLWSLGMVIVFEASTVFQRTRTQKMLGGMAPKGNPIFVHRSGRWAQISTKDLLPGDLISLSFSRTKVLQQPAVDASSNSAAAKPKAGDPQVSFVWDGSIPCDCLILKGSAVVNEASLTGESIPQMKEALTEGVTEAAAATAAAVVEEGIEPALEDEAAAASEHARTDAEVEATVLDINSLHRVNTLFSGTSALTIDGGWVESSGASASCLDGRISAPPDNGAVAYVLRTGFSSSQGKLMQMIEFSQQSVSGDSVETGLALLMLFCFAVISSGYVLYDGLQKKEKTTHEILLKCVIIITSVVPRQLPMQMAMAVNMALMSLTKAGIFCTEPHRVPMAGRITHILFDKTGTLTTDQLVPVGVVNAQSASAASSTVGQKHGVDRLVSVIDVSGEAAMVLAACHSLVAVAPPANAEGAESKDGEPDAAAEARKKAQNKKKLVGDPIELAAIKEIGWEWDADACVARPDRNVKKIERLIKTTRERLAEKRAGPRAVTDGRTVTPAPGVGGAAAGAKAIEELEKTLQTLEAKLVDEKKRVAASMCTSVQVLHRHHFSSGLQRMSVVAKCHMAGSNEVATFVLVKGSPEVIQSLAVPESLPEWYSATYDKMARQGLRVLALAYKRVHLHHLPASAADEVHKAHVTSILDGTSRHAAENELHFCGFIAFECKVRADSGVVVQALRDSDHSVSMLTGDALLTSLHVAKKVGICDADKECVTLRDGVPSDLEDASKYRPVWVLRHEATGTEEILPVELEAVNGEDGSIVGFEVSESHMHEIVAKYNILATELEFFALAEMTGGEASKLWRFAGFVRVFARMSPPGKATIIRRVKEACKDVESSSKGKFKSDVHVMMCGDGGNDVGALKQADVGLALLVGHASSNTTEDVAAEAPKGAAGKAIEANNSGGAQTSAEDLLNARDKALQQRSAELNKKRQEHMKAFQAAYSKTAQEEMQREIAELSARGEFMGMFSLMKKQAQKTQAAMNEENKRFMAMHGHIYDPKRDVDEGGAAGGGLASWMEQMDSGAAESGMGPTAIKPGDASIAAPFTSRIPSVRAVVDLIRQGRCTLLSALMQQQIMMLESTISAYTLSALSLHNARSSERQMMASSWLLMTAGLAFSYASPVDKMHPLRPLQSLFNPAIIVSILGQAAIHIACMTLAVSWATEAMGPEKLAEVTEFFRRARAKEIDQSELCAEDDMMCQFNAFWMAPFMPNLLNSVVFLVETSQMIAVYFANYKGRPWMKGMLENHPLFLSVYACIAGVVVASWEMVPQLNEMLQLAPFPDDAFRFKVVALVTATIFGTLVWDRICVWLFAPKVFAVMMEEARHTTPADLVPVLRTAGLIVLVVVLLGTGNLLLLGLGFYWWRRQKNANPTA